MKGKRISDKEMMDWLAYSRTSVYWNWAYKAWGATGQLRPMFKTPRQAIHAAMKSERRKT